MSRRFAVTLSLVLASLRGMPLSAGPFDGTPVDGFPTWSERVWHEWTNRSRSDPQADLAACPAGNCPDAGCYTPKPPLAFDLALTHSARYHSDEMFRQGFFGHPSRCSLVSTIGTLYPVSCDGSAACACVGGATCYPGCVVTDTFARIARFGATGSSEIIAHWDGADPASVFYFLLYEPAPTSTCSLDSQNGHRWTILSQPGSIGYGSSNGYHTGDFGYGGTPGRIPSGAHLPQSGATVDFWANWYDTAGPLSASVVVDGVPHALTLGRGTSTNGAWHVQMGGLGSACHRYYFSFTDKNGAAYTFPGTGSYGAGPAPSCPDWSASRTGATVKGDANGDGLISSADVFTIVNHLFAGGPAPAATADANGDHAVTVADVFYLINYLYADGPPPQ
jgi:dockerin type I repeat protein